MTEPTLHSIQLRAPSTEELEKLTPDQQHFHLQLDLSRRLNNGEKVRVESYFARYPSIKDNLELLIAFIASEICIRTGQGEDVELRELQDRFPLLSESLAELMGATSQAGTFQQARSLSPWSTASFAKEKLTDHSNRQTAPYSPSPDLTIPGYEILGELGRGGMGVVYKARQKRLNRLVALKMILNADHANKEARMRFEREAQAIARLNHPNIVEIYEISEHEGKPFFSLEFVTGGSLDRRLDGKPMSATQSAKLVETLCHGVAAAHRADVIHRDLKPANVLITEEGVPRITDFGLAKQLDDSEQTVSGAIFGTPSYMAPEQAEGKTHIIGKGADIYALGAILYECLTGRPPFRAASSWDTISQVIHQPPTPPSQARSSKIPRDLETICLKCLEKDPGRRYETAELLAEDLRHFLNGEPIQARPVTRAERFWRWCKRSPAIAGLLFLVLILLLAGPTVSTWFALQASKRAEDEAAARKQADVARERQKLLTISEQAANKKLGRAMLALSEEKGKVEKERDRAEEERKRAVRQQELAEIRLYASQLIRAQKAWKDGEAKQALKILESCQWDRRHIEHRMLWSLYNSNQIKIKGHSSGVNGVALSPDGKRIVSAGGDRVLKVWEVSTQREIRTLKGHDQSVTSVAFSSDGRYIVSGSEDRSIRVWDADTGRSLATFRGHASKVRSVAISPDAQRIASAGADGKVILWDRNEKQQPVTIHAHPQGAFSVCFSPNGQRVVSGGADNLIKVWDAQMGKMLLTLRGHSSVVQSVAFSFDNKRIVRGW